MSERDYTSHKYHFKYYDSSSKCCATCKNLRCRVYETYYYSSGFEDDINDMCASVEIVAEDLKSASCYDKRMGEINPLGYCNHYESKFVATHNENLRRKASDKKLFGRKDEDEPKVVKKEKKKDYSYSYDYSPRYIAPGFVFFFTTISIIGIIISLILLWASKLMIDKDEELLQYKHLYGFDAEDVMELEARIERFQDRYTFATVALIISIIILIVTSIINHNIKKKEYY